MVDFTGYACVNCRKMEEHVWPEQSVYSLLKNDYVIISLYVDDLAELPEQEQKLVLKPNGGAKALKNYRDKWQNLQSYYGAITQPYYVLLSPDEEKLLNAPVGYTPDDQAFSDFLKCGLSAYKRLSQK